MRLGSREPCLAEAGEEPPRRPLALLVLATVALAGCGDPDGEAGRPSGPSRATIAPKGIVCVPGREFAMGTDDFRVSRVEMPGHLPIVFMTGVPLLGQARDRPRVGRARLREPGVSGLRHPHVGKEGRPPGRLELRNGIIAVSRKGVGDVRPKLSKRQLAELVTGKSRFDQLNPALAAPTSRHR